MLHVTLAVNALLQNIGLIAAFIICLFILISVIVFLVINLVLAFALSWVREKVNVIKMLRPTVDSVNKASEAAARGIAPAEDSSLVVKTAARVPTQMHKIDSTVDHTTERVAKAVIEFRARTVQAKTMFKTFFVPGLDQERARAEERVSAKGLEFNSPGYGALREEPREVVREQERPLEQSSSARR